MLVQHYCTQNVSATLLHATCCLRLATKLHSIAFVWRDPCSTYCNMTQECCMQDVASVVHLIVKVDNWFVISPSVSFCLRPPRRRRMKRMWSPCRLVGRASRACCFAPGWRRAESWRARGEAPRAAWPAATPTASRAWSPGCCAWFPRRRCSSKKTRRRLLGSGTWRRCATCLSMWSACSRSGTRAS